MIQTFAAFSGLLASIFGLIRAAIFCSRRRAINVSGSDVEATGIAERASGPTPTILQPQNSSTEAPRHSQGEVIRPLLCGAKEAFKSIELSEGFLEA